MPRPKEYGFQNAITGQFEFYSDLYQEAWVDSIVNYYIMSETQAALSNPNTMDGFILTQIMEAHKATNYP